MDSLIERLEKAPKGNRVLDYAIAEFLGREAIRERQGTFAPWLYTTDLNAALTLVPPKWRVFIERLPVDSGPCWSVMIRPHAENGFESDWHESLALALCIAALKALKETGR